MFLFIYNLIDNDLILIRFIPLYLYFILLYFIPYLGKFLKVIWSYTRFHEQIYLIEIGIRMIQKFIKS